MFFYYHLGSHYNFLAMKKIFLLLLITICCFCPKTVAYADETKFSRITTDGVSLYIDPSLTMEWFTLPTGYYVKVISVSHTCAKVEYKSDNPTKPSAKGYISIDHLNVVDYTPTTPYPNLVLTVNQNCMLFKDIELTISETVTQNSSIDYYGIMTKANGEKYIYGYVTTSSGDKYVGYLPFSAVNEFVIPSLPITSTPTESVTSSEQAIKESSPVTNTLGSSLQMVIIIAVSIIAISVVYLLFKPAPTKASDEVLTMDTFYDE